MEKSWGGHGSQIFPQTWSGGLKVQRRYCCHVGDIHAISLSPLCLGPLLALIGRKLRLCGVELSWSSPATEFEPKTFCSTASILPFLACTSISTHQVIYFSWPYFAIFFSGCLSFSLCTWSKSVYPSKSSLNLVLPVIISPKHLSQNRAELASPNKN